MDKAGKGDGEKEGKKSIEEGELIKREKEKQWSMGLNNIENPVEFSLISFLNSFFQWPCLRFSHYLPVLDNNPDCICSSQMEQFYISYVALYRKKNSVHACDCICVLCSVSHKKWQNCTSRCRSCHPDLVNRNITWKFSFGFKVTMSWKCSPSQISLNQCINQQAKPSK